MGLGYKMLGIAGIVAAGAGYHKAATAPDVAFFGNPQVVLSGAQYNDLRAAVQLDPGEKIETARCLAVGSGSDKYKTCEFTTTKGWARVGVDNKPATGYRSTRVEKMPGPDSKTTWMLEESHGKWYLTRIDPKDKKQVESGDKRNEPEEIKARTKGLADVCDNILAGSRSATGIAYAAVTDPSEIRYRLGQ